MKRILRIFQKPVLPLKLLAKYSAFSICSFLPSLNTQSSSELVKFSEAKGNCGFKLYYRDQSQIQS